VRHLRAVLIALLALAPGLSAQETQGAARLRSLLADFLAGASRDDIGVHERFWADDLIYTSSSGRRMGKADILGDLRSPPVGSREAATSSYTAEDVRIQTYGDAALLAFRLIGTTSRGGRTHVTRYLNTGTFLRINGEWRAVGWQATRIPRPEAEAKQEVSEAEAAFRRALLAADVKTLEAMTVESFVWTDRHGAQIPRARLLEDLASGRLRYEQLESREGSVAIHGESAVARGLWTWRRTRPPAPATTGGAATETDASTMLFVHPEDGWKAAAMLSIPPGDDAGLSRARGE
jgi:ketosteroid isomerase-like protein